MWLHESEKKFEDMLSCFDGQTDGWTLDRQFATACGKHVRVRAVAPRGGAVSKAKCVVFLAIF